MKLNDVKHNHSLTDLLKILIFSILMMIPFIDVGIRCAYVVCNKNAYQSYSGETADVVETIALTDNTEIERNTKYYFTQNNNTYVPTLSESINYFNVVLVHYHDVDYENVRLGFYSEGNWVPYIYVRNTTTNVVLFNVRLDNDEVNKLYFYVDSFNNIDNNLVQYLGMKYNIYNNNYYLDNVFDYSVNKLTTSELYTWTQQTAIYTGVQTMCTQLGINNTVIPILLVYWFILTVIYIIIDIILKLFTMLTHAIGSKTA